MTSETGSMLRAVLAGRQPSDSRVGGFDAEFERHVRSATCYGSGKVALRDGAGSFAEAGENVVLPAYLPDAVREPFVELGLEPRYYRVRPTLAPDLADVERRIDADTAAVLSVNYFGFPQPELDALESLIDNYGCYHIDDNAHAPLSVADGALLGTRGDIGITSLRKQFPVPDGALLYCNDDAVRARFEPSSAAGVRDRFSAADYRFVATSLGGELLEAAPGLDRLVTARRPGATPNPTARYEASKRQMSPLSARVFEGADLSKIRATRRANYRAWTTVLAEREEFVALRPSLPEGVCPQAFPVRTSESKQLLADLGRVGIRGAATWPRLDEAVRTDPAYETARTLAEELVTLPVRQRIDPSSITAAGAALGW